MKALIGRTPIALLLGVAASAATFAGTNDAVAIERAEVLARARAFAMHPWRASVANGTATCNAAYQSIYDPGDYVGLPYDWGGYMSLFQFDQRILAGQGAGSYPEDGILDCTAGLDCSGFVSQTFQAGHTTTSSMATISGAIAANAMLPGDVYNEAGYHVAMLHRTLANGAPVYVEALGYNVHYNGYAGWAHVSGFIPRRYNDITGTSTAEPIGTPFNPIVVPGFPYSDARDTTQSKSDLFDGCGADPSKNESGREYVYEVKFTQPGTLTATVVSDAGVDIDVHVYRSTNTSDCFARNDTTVTVNVDCGTYLVVADTFRSSTSGEKPGGYNLSLSFSPSGPASSCGAGPQGYAPSGKLGDACGFPGDPTLPFCNPNLGGDTCLYDSSSSFCSKACAGASDCAALTGGCCADIGGGELYCLTAEFCGGEPPPDSEEPPAPDGDPDQEEVTGSGGAGSGFGGSGEGAGSSGDGSGPSGSGAGDAADGETEGGCAIEAGGARGSSGLWLAAAALGMAGLRRRRPRS